MAATSSTIWRRSADGSVAQSSSGLIGIIVELLGHRDQIV
jgi:hypothetical protein